MLTNLIKSNFLSDYEKQQPITLLKHINKLKKTVEQFDFGYGISDSAVYSSMIEGNPIDLDSFLKYSTTGMNTKSKAYKEIKDLISAYEFARKSKLNKSNFLKAHSILSQNNITEKKYSGKLRDKEVFVFAGGEKRFTGCPVIDLPNEIDRFFNDIEILINSDLSLNELFYFASMLHLVFVQIHPFADGNGRSARLIEKWFLAQKLGQQAWHIKSEKLYQSRIRSYYKNVNIGNDYKTINYNLSMPFLLMLPMALRIK